VCDDATILHRGLLADGGLAKRLTDITADGFSSEGRPLNYHFAGMTEYLPTLTYLRNSGLPLEVPFDRILAAVRMPLQRATLSGYVPTTGDNAAGSWVGPGFHYDIVYELFPQEEWLYEVGAQSTLRTMLKGLADGPPAADAWKKHLSPEPTHFPDAGFAILRQGDTPETQVYATLDYGRNVMHSGLDRLQITLWAFGRVFSPGPGSAYNAATNWPRGDPHALAFIGHGSLGHNLILCDTSDQLPAIGRLLLWSAAVSAAAGRAEAEASALPNGLLWSAAVSAAAGRAEAEASALQKAETWQARPEYQAIAAEVSGHYPGVTHRRALVLRSGVFVLLDEVTSAAEHTYDFVYHNFGELTPGEGWTTEPAAEPLGNRANYEHIRDLKLLRGEGALRLTWQVEEKASLAFWQVIPLILDPPAPGSRIDLPHVYLGLTGANNPDQGFVGADFPTVLVRTKVQSARFVTVLEPYREASRVTAVTAESQLGDEFRATITLAGDETFTVLFRPGAAGEEVVAVR
jgi:hypothetical protein